MNKRNNQENVIHKHIFELNYGDMDERVVLETEFHTNGDPDGIFLNQFLTINNYHHNNVCSLGFYSGLFNPDRLRELADQIEEAQKVAVRAAKIRYESKHKK